ncbi:XopAG/AvrGf1 family type III secretion system effector [Paracidovorax citrulli]|uniref:XopAG/AvrGf1 family type III secretion system effector n=1 Tax=Paracidovorax citrulli TaxID=80869 RepID=UPI000A71135B|nr:XopAG/AvrGf1 family type III secretion system effector [Paracidovorax citrulli]
MTSAPRRGGIPETAFPTGGGQDGTQNLPARAMKYVLGLAAAGYLCDKAANGFFLSTTSLHDGRGGFTSNARLDKAFTEAAAYRQRFHAAEPGERALQPRLPAFLKRCGNRQFVSMTDYRAATKVHLIERTDTPEARASLLKSLECLQGTLVKQECVDRYAPSSVPADFDLRNSALYGQKSKYALAGVSNTETGARGYTSRSITRPFVNRGLRHFKEDSERRGLSLRESSESLQAQLAKEGALSGTAQFAAGQTLLNFRQVYASDEHWGHAENVIMKFLVEQGLLSQRQTERIDESLMFEDPSKSVFKRNTGVAGPLLHRLETRFKEFLLRDDPEGLEDIRPMALSKNMGKPGHRPLQAERARRRFRGLFGPGGFVHCRQRRRLHQPCETHERGASPVDAGCGGAHRLSERRVRRCERQPPHAPGDRPRVFCRRRVHDRGCRRIFRGHLPRSSARVLHWQATRQGRAAGQACLIALRAIAACVAPGFRER